MSRNNFTNECIAGVIKTSPSTVSREFSRNGGKENYDCYRADYSYQFKRENRKNYKLTTEVMEFVKIRLEKKDSPVQIHARMIQELGTSISHEWIYKKIYEEKASGGNLYVHLRWGRKRRRKRLNKKDRRGVIPNRVSIEKRPKRVDQNLEYGHWEGDTIVGKGHQSHALVMVERKSKFTIIKKLADGGKDGLAKAIISIVRKKGLKIKSLTLDNGLEFAAHEIIAKTLKTKIYFAHPYSPWERGLCENTNGLIRQFIPKSTDINKVSDKKIIEIQNNLNNRWRKLLNFRPPNYYLNKIAFQC